ncbi:MAG: hypothetical protein ACRC80_11870 [Waterburya sp.]
MQILTLPQPPSLNKIINSARKNVYESARIKKEWTLLVATLAKDLKPIKSTCWIALDFTYQRSNCDPDNLQAGILKVALDGLVLAGILPGDSVKHISSPIFTSYNKSSTKTAQLFIFDTFVEYADYIRLVLATSGYLS